MPVIFDFKCTSCGHIIFDHMLRNSNEDAPDCPICENKMEKLYTGMYTPKGTKHHHQIPSDYKFSKGGVNFGRLQDL